MTAFTRVKTLRHAAQELRGDLKDGRELSHAYESSIKGLRDMDRVFLHNMVRGESNPHFLIKLLTSYIEDNTNWIVVLTTDHGDVVRTCYPCDLDAATNRLREYILRGKNATLIAE